MCAYICKCRQVLMRAPSDNADRGRRLFTDRRGDPTGSGGGGPKRDGSQSQPLQTNATTIAIRKERQGCVSRADYLAFLSHYGCVP